MAEQHMATPEQWAAVAEVAPSCWAATIIELRARVEALEAAANYPAKPDSSPAPAGSLVERVATAMQPGTFDYSAYEPEARAAIREVAAWLREAGDEFPDGVALLLEQEANRG